jgi:hypothetical protein
MFTPEQYRAKAAKLNELAKTASNHDDAQELQRREHSLTALADNQQWMSEHPDQTVHAIEGEDVQTDASNPTVAIERWDDEGGAPSAPGPDATAQNNQ